MTFLFFILDLLFLLGLTWLIYYYSAKNFLSTPQFLIICIIKISAGIGLGLLYLFYYNGGDTFSYFQHGQDLTDIFKNHTLKYLRIVFLNNSWENMPYNEAPRAVFMVKLVSLVNLLTFNNYWWTSVFFSIFCYSGLLSWASTLNQIYPNRKLAIVFSLLLFPSLVFWSSGIMKETVAMGAIGFLMSSFLGYIFIKRKPAIGNIITNLFLLWLLWNTKYYYCGVFLLVISSITITLIIKNKVVFVNRRVIYQIALFGLSGIFTLVAVSLLHPNFELHNIADVMVRNYYKYQQISNPDDVFTLGGLEPNLLNLAAHVPKALFSGLFKPMPGESYDILKILYGFENLGLVLLIISALFKLPTFLSTENRLLLLGGIAYCLILAIFLAISTPNFGTLARYKVGFLPVLILILSINNPIFNKAKTLIK